MRSRCQAVLLSLGFALAHAPLRAQPSTPPEDAAALYHRGAELLRDGRAAEALEVLQASSAQMPSANTNLLVAHALRLLGRRVEAMVLYEEVVRIAGARVRAGEERFGATVADAGRWTAVLRTELGELSVEVTRAPEGAALSIDGVVAAGRREGPERTLRVRVWHEPGPAVVALKLPAGAARSVSARVIAGGVATVHLEGDARPVAGLLPSRSVDAPSRAPPTASWIAFGAGAAGLATFAIFGAMASSAASELEPCSPRCSQDKKSTADGGQRDATIANVALAVAGAAIVTGGVVWLVSIGGSDPEPTPRSRAALRPWIGVRVAAP